MALLLSATDLAIGLAVKSSTLRLIERPSRFAGETFVSIEDEAGTIEVATDMAEAEARVAKIKLALN